ncbi:MAG: hypothetical protein BWY31_03625 [Lentisphaerae bacterium ADurb.Bin242]|nr:MAG: hypothetical protein BWY31_03625 [Lentisphaerae bacterium ADurb.Bin242]
MKRLFSLLIFSGVFLSSFCFGNDLTVAAKNTKSVYQIVVPDSTGNAALDRFLLASAETLNRCIARAVGAGIPVVKESAMNRANPAIFIGDTRALRQAGADPSTLKLWEHRIEVNGKNIFLYGCDIKSNPGSRWPNDRISFVLGSVKAVTVFLEKFVNTRFVAPGAEGIAVLPLERIAVPERYSYRKSPKIEYCISRGQDLMYDAANNAFYAPWYGSYGGHSHNVAIPQDKYFKSNPEYFALIKGKRTTHPTRPQYCLSNSKVQEMIYRELLEHLDKGYRMVQLGQSDGFRECECEECVKLYGVKDFGEKLWIMHRRMAERLLKDRPGKMVCIMAYGPTRKPPQTFKDFPDNVMIELAPFSEEGFNAWKNHRVKNGFTVYLYNWGWYQAEGFTPKRDMDFLAKQAAAFNRNNVRGIYRCGFGELFGLEGPAYYQWGKQLDDPALDSGKLLSEYCLYAFGPAAGSMEKFYLLLNERLKRNLPNRNANWNDPALLDGRNPAMLDNMRLLALRYPPEVLEQLETLLARTEKENPETNPAKFLLPVVRMEFDYLKKTASVVTAFEHFRKTKSDADFEVLAKAVDARNRFIAGIPVQPNTKPPRPALKGSLRLFGYPTVDEIEDGGSLTAPLMAPFNWDVRWMMDNRIKPAGRILKTGGAPQLLVQKDFYRQAPEIKEDPVSVQCRRDEQNLYVTFLFGKATQKAVNNDQIQVILGNGKARWWFTARARNGVTGFYERVLSSADNRGNGDQYKMIAGKNGKITAPAPGVDGTSALITIPWSLVGGAPAKGAEWEFNAIRETPKVRYIWEYNLYQKTWRNWRDAAGTIVFE